MADTGLKDKIATVLRDAYFHKPGDYVDVSDGDADSVHVLIISRQLDGRRVKEKRDLIWGALVAGLAPAEWQQISVLVAKSPEEVKAG